MFTTKEAVAAHARSLPATAVATARRVAGDERGEGVINLSAEHLTSLRLPVRTPSRDFH